MVLYRSHHNLLRSCALNQPDPSQHGPLPAAPIEALAVELMPGTVGAELQELEETA